MITARFKGLLQYEIARRRNLHKIRELENNLNLCVHVATTESNYAPVQIIFTDKLL